MKITSSELVPWRSDFRLKHEAGKRLGLFPRADHVMISYLRCHEAIQEPYCCCREIMSSGSDWTGKALDA